MVLLTWTETKFYISNLYRYVYSELLSTHNPLNVLNYLQSNEVKSSNHMEKCELVDALQFLADDSLQVTTLVTDCHKQIAKYMAEEKPDIEHRYDVWHISKGMYYNNIHLHNNNN